MKQYYLPVEWNLNWIPLAGNIYAGVWTADEGENRPRFDCTLQNLYTITSPVHIISLHNCALICAEGCVCGHISRFSKTS